MVSETYTPQRDMLIRDIVKLMRHAGCGGRASKEVLVVDDQPYVEVLFRQQFRQEVREVSIRLAGLRLKLASVADLGACCERMLAYPVKPVAEETAARSGL